MRSYSKEGCHQRTFLRAPRVSLFLCISLARGGFGDALASGCQAAWRHHVRLFVWNSFPVASRKCAKSVLVTTHIWLPFSVPSSRGVVCFFIISSIHIFRICLFITESLSIPTTWRSPCAFLDSVIQVLSCAVISPASSKRTILSN